jgi:hypothetical protein
MLSKCRYVLAKYKTLIVKMWEDEVESEATQFNVSKLNVELIW